MEWVETTGRTVDEAKDLALDQLGVDEADAEFDIVEEPRPGLFGRVRGQARVRARVRPTRPRPKVDRRERRKRTNDSTPASAADSDVTTPARSATPDDELEPVAAEAGPASRSESRDATRRRRGRRTNEPGDSAPEEVITAEVAGKPTVAGESGGSAVVGAPASNGGEPPAGAPTNGAAGPGGPDAVAPVASGFLAGLAGAFGLEATTATEIDGEELEVRLDGADLGLMIGPRGQTLLAIQDLARTVSQRGIPDHGRLRIDVGGYRERRREALARFTAEVARQVLEGGAPKMLEPMAAADRKVVHDTASAIEGVLTRSEGEEPNRRVVILPAT